MVGHILLSVHMLHFSNKLRILIPFCNTDLYSKLLVNFILVILVYFNKKFKQGLSNFLNMAHCTGKQELDIKYRSCSDL